MKAKINICFLCVLLGASLWGTAGIFVREIEKTAVGEMQIVFGRCLFSALILGLIILFKDRSLFRIKFKDLWLFIAGGIFSIVLFNYSYYTTMSLTTLSVAAVLLYTAPFFVVILSLFIFREKFTLNKILACIIAFIGCCFATGLFDSAQSIGPKALFFGLLTGFGYALYTIFSELLIKRGYRTLTITFYVFFIATLGTIPFISPVDTVNAFNKEPISLLIIFLMAIFNTVIPYILYTTGLLGVEPSVAPIIATVEPVVATIVGVFYGENISVFGVFGIILVLISVAILNIKFNFSKSLTARANAKINLSLDITGKREDGYHSIDTVMQSVSLYDNITVKKAEKINVFCSNGDINQQNNIAYRAAEIFFETVGINKGAEIHIEKNIPLSAGLGGGSADAAAVILSLDKLYNTSLSKEKLCELAVKLGADVPFFIKGGTQRSEGIGEILTPINSLKNGYFILVKQGNKSSTGEMYKRLDSENPPHPDIDSAVEAIEQNNLSLLAQRIDNSFVSVNKEFALKETLLSLGALAVSLSGSGPTWFAIFEDKNKAEAAFCQLKKAKIEAYLAEPCDYAINLE